MKTILQTRTEKKGGGNTDDGYFDLCRRLLSDPAYATLKLIEQRVLHALTLHMDPTGHCWPSVRTLAKYSGIVNYDGENIPTWFYTALTGLEEKRFLVIKRGKSGRGNPNHYDVCVPSDEETSVNLNVKRNRKTSVNLNVRNVGESQRETSVNLNVKRRRISPPELKNASEPHSNSRRVGVENPPSGEVKKVRKKVSKADQMIIKAFRDLGVKKTSLIKAALKKRGRDWMDAFLMLILAKDARDEIGNVAAFAVWGLSTKKKVDLDTSPKPTACEVREYDAALNGNGNRKKKRKKYRSPVEVMKKSVDGRRYGWDCDPLAGQREGERRD